MKQCYLLISLILLTSIQGSFGVSMRLQNNTEFNVQFIAYDGAGNRKYFQYKPNEMHDVDINGIRSLQGIVYDDFFVANSGTNGRSRLGYREQIRDAKGNNDLGVFTNIFYFQKDPAVKATEVNLWTIDKVRSYKNPLNQSEGLSDNYTYVLSGNSKNILGQDFGNWKKSDNTDKDVK